MPADSLPSKRRGRCCRLIVLPAYMEVLMRAQLVSLLLSLSLLACGEKAAEPTAPASVPVAPVVDPSSPLGKAQAFKAQGRLEEAAALLQESINAPGEDLELHRTYQDLLRGLGKAAEGRTFYEGRKTANPGSAVAWYLFGRSIILESPTEAEEAFRKATELDPSLLYAYLGLGTVQSMRGDAFTAVQIYERAQEKFPTSSDLFYNLAAMRLEIGALRTAIEAAEKSVALAPQNARAHELLGLIYKKQGDIDQAKKSLEKALSLDERLAGAHVALAELLLGQQDQVGALAHAKRGKELGETLPAGLAVLFPGEAGTGAPAAGTTGAPTTENAGSTGSTGTTGAPATENAGVAAPSKP